ncbi:MICOS complex subunit MIC27-like [Paramacrobiotus metropolitanus]|uniref:MICOS complex subunit MIC27-like n=1 Tax=Paramacrobiotus metropolitanus TaxID=2943436 RepID=UPI002445ACE5|nr:MICOS complex subunit MIC27-like [Paramacrobiotus metropolitanus]
MAVRNTGILLGASLLSSPVAGRKDDRVSVMLKVTDLPVYEEQAPVSQQAYFVEPTPPSFLEQQISQVRQAVASVLPEGSEKVRERVSDIYATGKAHSQSTLDMLRDDARVLPRALAISAGGLIGFLAAYRRGVFRKLLYTGIGLGAAAAVCYPKASRELASAAYYQTKDVLKKFEKPKPVN